MVDHDVEVSAHDVFALLHYLVRRQSSDKETSFVYIGALVGFFCALVFVEDQFHVPSLMSTNSHNRHKIMFRSTVFSAVVAMMLSVSSTVAFTAPPTSVRAPAVSSQVTTRMAAAIGSNSKNPLSRLPWNAERERQKAARRLKAERNQLHRQLGIAEDATYEEIVAATDALIAKAGSDLKAKVKIEIAKDKILQIRLNERLAGLATATKDDRAQSGFEQEG